MSRIFGKMFDVYNVSKELKNADLPKFKRDNSLSSWNEIDVTPERIEIYLPDKAIEFLTCKKTKIMKTNFLKYTLTQVPDSYEEERFIKFPSHKPKNEFKRELMFYMGMLLSSYSPDFDESDFYVSHEFDDTLPLYLEYLYLKESDKEKDFSLKHLNELKKYTKDFPKSYDDYEEFENFRRDANYNNLDKIKTEKFIKLCKEKDEDITNFTRDCVIQLSSMEGVLALIEKVKSKEDIKKVIEELMLNKHGSRGLVMSCYGIDSYGYKSLRKEIAKYK